MADEELSADLELDIGGALSSVDQLGQQIESALGSSAETFSSQMADAVASVPDVVIDPDVTAVDPAISAAVLGADTEAEVTADATAITPEIDAAVAAVDGEVQVDATGTDAITGEIESAVSSAESTVDVDADTGPALSMIDALDGLVPDVTIEVDADTSDAVSAIDDLGASAESSGASMQSGAGSATEYGAAVGAASAAAGLARGETGALTSTVGGLSSGLGAAVGVGGAFAATLGVLYEKGVNSQGAMDRFNATLGESAEAVQAIKVGNLNTDMLALGESLGAGGREMRNAASSAFQFATNSGAADKQAVTFTQTILALAARAVALNPNLGSVGEVAEQMGARLARGGRFAQRFGLDLTAAEINARALGDTGKSSAADLTLYEKSAAAAAIATEKYGAALKGDIATGSENAIIQQRKLEEQFNNILATLGRSLVIPMFDLIKAGLPIVEQFGVVVADLGQAALPILKAAFDTVTPVLQLTADILGALPGPVVTAGVAVLGLSFAMSKLATTTVGGGIGFAKLGGALDTTGGKLGVAAVGATLAAAGFQQAGEGGVEGAVGIGEMALGGAALGASLASVTGIGIPAGAAIGAVAGAAIGAAKAVFASGESLDDYRQKFEKLGTEIDHLSAGTALKKFTDQLGDLDKFGLQGGKAVRLITDEITALGSSSPQAAQKVVDGFVKMREEAGKPLSHAAIDELNDAVDKGGKIYARHVVEQQKSAAANAEASAAAVTNAQATTNESTAQKAAADAVLAHSTALAQSTTAYASTTLAAQAQAAADANMIAQSQQAALATRSVGDATAAVAQEQLSYSLAVDGATSAVARYLFGAGTAKEATDAEASSVSALRTELQLLEGNYLSAVSASLGLEAQTITFNATLDAQNGTLGANRAEVIASEQSLLGMGNAAIQASTAAAQNGEAISAQIAPLQTYQNELETVKTRLIEAGDTGGAAFVQSLQDSNARAIANLQASESGFAGAADSAVGGAVNSARNQGGNMAGATSVVGQQGVGGLGSGLGGASDVASNAVNQAANAAGLAGANMHNIGYGIGTSFSQGMGEGIYANSNYVAGAAASIVAGAIAAAHDAVKNPPFPSKEGQRIGFSLGYGVAVGLEDAASYAADAAGDLAGTAVGMLDGASSPFTPGPLRSGGGGGDQTIQFNIEVHGVQDPETGRAVGEQIAEGATSALGRRGFVVTARMG